MSSLLSFGDMIPNGIGYAGDLFNDFKPYIFILLGLGIAFFIIEVLLDWIEDKTESKKWFETDKDFEMYKKWKIEERHGHFFNNRYEKELPEHKERKHKGEKRISKMSDKERENLIAINKNL